MVMIHEYFWGDVGVTLCIYIRVTICRLTLTPEGIYNLFKSIEEDQPIAAA